MWASISTQWCHFQTLLCFVKESLPWMHSYIQYMDTMPLLADLCSSSKSRCDVRLLHWLQRGSGQLCRLDVGNVIGMEWMIFVPFACALWYAHLTPLLLAFPCHFPKAHSSSCTVHKALITVASMCRCTELRQQHTRLITERETQGERERKRAKCYYAPLTLCLFLLGKLTWQFALWGHDVRMRHTEFLSNWEL